MKRFMALVLTLALLSMAVGAMAEGFSFRNGITWGATSDEVKAAESGNEIEGAEMTTDNNLVVSNLVIDDVTAAGLEAVAVYVFIGDELVGCAYAFDEEDATLEKLEQALTKKYGDSVPTDYEYVNKLMGTFGGGGIDLDDNSVCWNMEDGTLIMLTDAYEDIEIIYLNGQRILEINEAATAAAATAAAQEEEVNTDGL